MEKSLTYWAFISYSHGDKEWCDWLHKSLETYKIPSSLRSGVGKRLYPIFRDREELPVSANLGSQLSSALAHSKSLLVICSPRSAQSMWVNQEIINYQKLSPDLPIIALLVDGQDVVSDDNDYCLPQAMVQLLAEDKAVCIDARKLGKSRSLVLQLLSKLTGQALSGFVEEDAKSRSIQNFLKGVVITAIVVASILIWKQVQDSRIQALTAQAQSYSVKAQQAWSNNQSSEALKAILQAVEIAKTNASIEVERQTKALLNQIMTTPLLELDIGRLDQEIIHLKPSGNPNIWLLEDSERGLHVFDLKSGKVIWSLPTKGLQAYAVNSEQQLIVRVDGKMQNFDLLTGDQHCQLELETQTALPEPGRLDWLQQSWFAELTGVQTEQGNFVAQQVQFVDSKTCTLTEKRNLGFSTSFGLVAVLDDEKFVIAFDTFNTSDEGNSQAVNIIQSWPKNIEQAIETIIAIPGVMKQHVSESHNEFQYDGPIYKTRADAPVTYITFQNEQTGDYEIVRMDWASPEVTHRQVIANYPKDIYWANADRDAVLVVSQVVNGEDYDNEFMAFDANNLTPHGPYPMKSMGAFSVSGDFSYMLSDSISGVVWTNLVSKEYFELNARGRLGQPGRLINWLTSDSGILAHQDGRITKVVANQSLQLMQLDDENCCAGTLDAKDGLLLGHDGSIYQLRGTSLDRLATSASKDAEYKRLSERHLLLKIPRLGAYLEYNYKVWDLQKKEMIFEFQANKNKLNIGSRWLTLQTDDGIVLTDFIEGTRKQIEAPEGLIKTQLSADGQILLMATYLPSVLGGDGFTHFSQMKVSTGDILSDVAYEIGDVSMSSEIWLDLTRQKAVASTFNAGATQLQLLGLARQDKQVLGSMRAGSRGFSDKTVIIMDDYVLISAVTVSGTLHNLFDVVSGQQISVRDGQRLLVTPELMTVQVLVQIDDTSHKLNLMHLRDRSLHQIDCPYEFGIEAFVIDTQSIGLQTRKDVCVVDVATGKVSKRLSSPKLGDGGFDFGEIFGEISAYVIDAHNQPVALTYSGLLVSSPAPKSWTQQLARARQLMAGVEIQAQKEP